MLFLKKSWKLDQKGFTLIEILLTIAILGLVILPLSGFFVQSGRLSAEAKEKLICSQIAQRYLERYRINADQFKTSTSETAEYQDTQYPDYHVVVTVAPFATAASAPKKFDYKYPTESDELSNVDINIVINDDKSLTNQGKIFGVKGAKIDGVPPFFSVDNGTSDVFLDVTINKESSNVTFKCWKDKKEGPSLIDSLSENIGYDLSKSILDGTHNAEYIRIIMNTNQNLFLGMENKRSLTENLDCIVYVVHPKGKSGKVTAISTVGKNEVINFLHDRTMTEGLPENGLYKVSISVYRGNDTTGKKIYDLDSYLR